MFYVHYIYFNFLVVISWNCSIEKQNFLILQTNIFKVQNKNKTSWVNARNAPCDTFARTDTFAIIKFKL